MLIVSVVELSEFVIHAIQKCLHDNVPALSQFRICSNGKHLGWFLGVNCVNSSYQAPEKKIVHRVDEFVSGAAPAALAIPRCNHRAVSVVSHMVPTYRYIHV